MALKIDSYFKEGGSRAANSGIAPVYGSEGGTKPQKSPRPVEEQLEANIIDDIPVNFLFARGKDLRTNLIDIERAFRTVKKIEGREDDA